MNGTGSEILYLDLLSVETECYVLFNDFGGEVRVTKICCMDGNFDLSALLKCKIRHGYIVRVLLEKLAEDGV